MSTNSLGNITVQLLAKSDQFEAGLAKAASATAQFGQQVTRSSDQWSAGFARTNAQWDNYLKLDDKVSGVGKLSQSLRQLGQIVGPNLGGHFLRLAGNMERVLTIGKKFAGLPAFGGAGAGTPGSWALTRGVPIAGAAIAGASTGRWLDENFDDLIGAGAQPNRNKRGISGRLGNQLYDISMGIGEKLGILEVRKSTIGWKAHFDALNAGLPAELALNKAFLDRRGALERETRLLAENAEARRQSYKGITIDLFNAVTGAGSKKSESNTITAALEELGAFTDTDTKWDKFAKKIGAAREAIDKLWQTGKADPYWLGRANEMLNEFSLKASEMEEKEKKAFGGGPRGEYDFRVVDSLSRLASGGGGAGQGIEGAQLGVLNRIDATLRDMRNRMNHTPVVVGGN